MTEYRLNQPSTANQQSQDLTVEQVAPSLGTALREHQPA